MRRRSGSKQLTGPKGAGTWLAWRAARNKAIANPPCNRAAQKLNGSRPPGEPKP